MGTLGCAACGPGSLLGPRHPQSECVLSRDRCALWDIDKYITCSNCKNKYSPDCLRKTFRDQKVHEHESSLSEDLSVHDPQGVWQMLKDQPWRQGTSANVLSNACAVGFMPKRLGVSAAIPHCFSCEGRGRSRSRSDLKRRSCTSNWQPTSMCAWSSSWCLLRSTLCHTGDMVGGNGAQVHPPAQSESEAEEGG